jgi:hypothetical protein
MENFIIFNTSDFNSAKSSALGFMRDRNNGNDARCFVFSKWKEGSQVWVYEASSRVEVPEESPAFGRSLAASVEEGNFGVLISESCLDKSNPSFQYGLYAQFMSIFPTTALLEAGEIVFPTLTGSEKQQKWGNDLRNNLRKLFWKEEPFMLFLSQKEKASYFIDLQNASIPSELEDEFDEFADSNLFKSFKMNDLKPLFLFANGLLK